MQAARDIAGQKTIVMAGTDITLSRCVATRTDYHGGRCPCTCNILVAPTGRQCEAIFQARGRPAGPVREDLARLGMSKIDFVARAAVSVCNLIDDMIS